MPATRDTSQRRLQISELVRQHGSVQVTALAKRFGVSMQTVRKDLRFLSERGVMARAYGGGIDSKVVGGPAAEATETVARMIAAARKSRSIDDITCATLLSQNPRGRTTRVPSGV